MSNGVAPNAGMRDRELVTRVQWMSGTTRCAIEGYRVGKWFLVKLLRNGVVAIEGNLADGYAVLVCRDGIVASETTFPADCGKVVDTMERYNANQGNEVIRLTVSTRCLPCMPVLTQMGYKTGTTWPRLELPPRVHGRGSVAKKE